MLSPWPIDIYITIWLHFSFTWVVAVGEYIALSSSDPGTTPAAAGAIHRAGLILWGVTTSLTFAYWLTSALRAEEMVRLRRLGVGGVGQGEVTLRATASTRRGGEAVEGEGEGAWRELKFVIGVNETLQWDGSLATLVVAQ